MQAFLKDVTYAWRTLRSSPAFSLTAIITLALGIGASTAIFSVVNAVLLRPLPYGNAERLTLDLGRHDETQRERLPVPARRSARPAAAGNAVSGDRRRLHVPGTDGG